MKSIKYLYDIGFIKEVLADGNNKFMGICKLSNSNVYDILILLKLDMNNFGVLYFTSLGDFNTYMRSVAIKGIH